MENNYPKLHNAMWPPGDWRFRLPPARGAAPVPRPPSRTQLLMTRLPIRGIGALVCLLKDFLREFGQCVPPHLPLVHAWGRIPHVADVVLLQIVGDPPCRSSETKASVS